MANADGADQMFQYPLMDRLGLRAGAGAGDGPALGAVSVSSDGSTWFEGFNLTIPAFRPSGVSVSSDGSTWFEGERGPCEPLRATRFSIL